MLAVLKAFRGPGSFPSLQRVSATGCSSLEGSHSLVKFSFVAGSLEGSHSLVEAWRLPLADLLDLGKRLRNDCKRELSCLTPV